MKLNDIYKGVETVNGELYNINESKEYNDEKRPFKAFLDVGLVRTTTGNRVFGAMKGATDGGLHIPHNEKRFPGLKVEKAAEIVNKRGKKQAAAAEEDKGPKVSYNADVHRQHIFGLHVQGYMDKLKKDKTKFATQFSQWDKCLQKAKVANLEAFYKKVHAEIRKSPTKTKKAKATKVTRNIINKGTIGFIICENSKKQKWMRHKKLTKAQRTVRVENKIKKAASKSK